MAGSAVSLRNAHTWCHQAIEGTICKFLRTSAPDAVAASCGSAVTQTAKRSLDPHESPGEPANIGYWTEPSAWLSYTFQLRKGGTFDIVLETSAIDDGSKLQLSMGRDKLDVDVPNTGDYAKYEKATARRMKLDEPGVYTLEVRPQERGWKPVKLRTVTLVPSRRSDAPGRGDSPNQ